MLACDPPNVVEHYDPVFEVLSGQRRVLCLELPGFGFSRPAPGFGFGIEEYAGVVEHVLDDLEISTATLAFPCVWSYLALRIAARRPGLVESLVLIQGPQWHEEVAWARRIDTTGLIHTPFVGQVAMQVGARWVARRWYHAALPRNRDATTTAAFAGPAEDALRRGGVFCLASLTQAWFGAATPTLHPVAQPGVILWGGADRTHRSSTPESALSYLADGRILIDRDAGHFPELENPTRLLDALTAIPR